MTSKQKALLMYFHAPRCRSKTRQARRGTQAMAFPRQVPQHRLAGFAAQPEGTVLSCRRTALLVAHLE
ncbi:hypothetical protein D3879_04045 [Pseudomonas cavernicola]|uniref:Uncharacterized protein n=1 Tax=Pseudomonas cavernicola TaxID=2320866 RepID=A0A418XJ31_9PSED|nr:hypothetical protein D3879_04045 [Pseudomonas cavernicola]